MGLFGANWYYYTLKRGWKINYSKMSVFHCVQQDKDRKEAKAKGIDYHYDQKHIDSRNSGQIIRETVQSKRWEDENGDTHQLTEIVFKKVYKGRKDLKCTCGSKVVFMGYPTYLEKVKKEGKEIGGLFKMGGESRRYPTRYFKTRNAQERYISKILNSKYND